MIDLSDPLARDSVKARIVDHYGMFLETFECIPKRVLEMNIYHWSRQSTCSKAVSVYGRVREYMERYGCTRGCGNIIE